MALIDTCVLWSGGKDCFTAHLLDREAVGAPPSDALLVTCGPPEPRFRCHPVEFAAAQARGLGAGHEIATIDPADWRRSYGSLFADLGRRGFRRLVTGDMVREPWLAEACAAAGLELVLPLYDWPDPAEQLDEMARRGVVARVTGVRAEFDRPGLLGSVATRELLARTGLADLPGFHPCGENGEYHTVVTEFLGEALVPGDLTSLGTVERDGIVSLDFERFFAVPAG